MGLFSVVVLNLIFMELCGSETVFIQGSIHYQPEQYLILGEL